MYKLQIRYASKRHYTTIETSISAQALAWGFKQCLAPYGVAGVRVIGPSGEVVVHALAKTR